MRLILLLIVIIAIFAFVQSNRHGCVFGDDGWFDCVVGKTMDEVSGGPPPAETAVPVSAPAVSEPAAKADLEMAIPTYADAPATGEPPRLAPVTTDLPPLPQLPAQ